MIPNIKSTLLTFILLVGPLAFAQGSKNQLVESKSSVIFENISADIQASVRKKIPALEAGPVDAEILDEAMKLVHTQSDFEMVQLLQHNDKYIIKIVQSDQLKILIFRGLSIVTQSEAESQFSWKSGQTFTEENVREGVERLKSFYRSRGYLKPEITYEIVRDSKQKLQAVVGITENNPTVINAITVQSTNEDLNKILIRDLKSRRKPILSEEELSSIQEKIKEELFDGKYLRAEIRGPTISYSREEDRADLTYEILQPIQYSFEFKGAEHFSQRQLTKTMDLETYISTNPNVSSDMAVRIKNAYIARGYARIEIEEKLVVDRPTYKKIQFNLKEGPRVKIEKWIFTGKITQDQKNYIKLTLNGASEIIDDGYFVKEDLDSAVGNLRVALQNEGYLTAKIISTRYQYNRERDKVTVYVNLDEGPLTYISEVIFDGNTQYSDAQLREQIEMKDGRPLFLNLIENSIAKIRTFYQENGYLEMNVINDKTDLITYNEDNSKAVVKFAIKEGPKVQVSSILLEGNSFTQDNVIRSELEFREGDLLTPAKIEDSVVRLQRTGYFNTIEIRTLEENTMVTNRTVIVRVTERNPGLFTMGVGATNERDLTLRGYTGIGYNNILGTGRGVSLRLQGNYNVTDIKYLETQMTAGYLEPHIFNTKNRGRFNLNRSKLVTDYNRRKITETNQTTYSLERDINRHLSVTWDVWSLATVIDYSLANTIDRKEQNIATTSVTLDLDYRNNIFNPTSGNFTRLNYEYSHPSFGGNETIHYWKTVESFSYYKPFWKTWNWAQLYRVGYMENLGTRADSGVPYDKKGFILGGQSTIRGFQAGTHEAFPNNNQLGIADSDSTYILKTQSSMAMWKSEVRFPLFGNFGGALFYDGGYVDITGLQFEDYYRDAAGFGLRYNTPVGPFNMEVGRKLDRKAGEDEWVFHLSIGTF